MLKRSKCRGNEVAGPARVASQIDGGPEAQPAVAPHLRPVMRFALVLRDVFYASLQVPTGGALGCPVPGEPCRLVQRDCNALACARAVWPR
eukprot:2681403-Heterocapsa_arctica.AAC.1